jgi:hypothetical protein
MSTITKRTPVAVKTRIVDRWFNGDPSDSVVLTVALETASAVADGVKAPSALLTKILL